MSAILIRSVYAGLFAGGMGILLTAPPRLVMPSLLCGFAGRISCDILMSWGMNQNWSTLIAAAVIVLVAAAVIRGHMVSPVVLFSGIVPLGAAAAMFKAIVGVMKVSSLRGEALSEVSDALVANIGTAFTTTLAIVLGLGVGLVIVRLFKGERIWKTA